MLFRPPQPTTEESVKCSTANDFEKTHEWIWRGESNSSTLERRKKCVNPLLVQEIPIGAAVIRNVDLNVGSHANKRLSSESFGAIASTVHITAAEFHGATSEW